MSSVGRLRVEVLCEDQEHEAFARRFFERWHGVDRRRIRVTVAPDGQGAAEQWVTRQFADFARKARANRHQRRLGFLAIVDGDRKGLAARKAALEEQAAREPGDRVAIWAPTWEIETWVLWLTRTPVDGEQVNERRPTKSALPSATFRDLLDPAVEAWRSPHPGEAESLPSLTDARREVARID